MGVVSTLLLLISAVVGIVAVAIGLLFSGAVSQYTPVFVWLDNYESERGKRLKGIIPATHRDEEWGFTHKELQSTDLSGQVVLVTGGNAGLGYWSSLNLAKAGATVVITCRTEAKGAKAAAKIKAATGKKVHPMVLELSSAESIVKFAHEFKGKYETLDALMLNAGIMMTPFGKTKDGIEQQIGVNHFGHALLTHELLPLLESTAAANGVATITVVSSSAHYNAYPDGILGSFDEMNKRSRYDARMAYGQSKLANVLFAQELSERLASKNILVNAIHPGGVDTELGRYISDVEGDIAKMFVTAVANVLKQGMWKPRDASLTQIFAAVGTRLKEEKITGRYFHPIARVTKPDPHTRNKKLQKHLWELTESFIQSHTEQ